MGWEECPFCGAVYLTDEDIIECSCGATYVGDDSEGEEECAEQKE